MAESNYYSIKNTKETQNEGDLKQINISKFRINYSQLECRYCWSNWSGIMLPYSYHTQENI